MPQAKNTLIVTDLNEISFVPEGDNPPALIKLCKAKAPISQEGAVMAEENQEDVYVTKADYLALQKRMAEMEEASAIEKVKVEADTLIRKICGPVKDIDLASTLREIDRKAPDASGPIRKILNVCGERIQKGGIHKLGTTAPGGISAADQFEQVIADIQKSNPKLSKNEALLKAAGDRPDLYEASKRGE